MRILVITRAPWCNDNNTGNTMTNFFDGMDGVELYNLYFRDQIPENNIVVKSFSVSEGMLIRNLLKKTPVGKETDEVEFLSSKKEAYFYNSAKKSNKVMLTWLRDLLWTVGRWKSESFKSFLDALKPDLIFMPVFNCYYPHKVLQFVKKRTGAKIALFHADDNYTLKQFSLFPLYWLYRFNLRKWIRRSVKISDINYAISNIQKIEYEKAFNRPFKVLTKGLDFSDEIKGENTPNEPLQLVYTGNIGVNRWKSLGIIASVLKRINSNGLKAQMKIYTGSPLTKKMKNALNAGDSSMIMGFVSCDKVADIQQKADILIHVEAMDLKNKLLVRQSFSTKLVDYFHCAKCILAVGPKDVASIDHLIVNDAAVVADSEKELEEKLRALIDNPALINEYAQKAWKCGKQNHKRSNVQAMLKEDIERVVKQNESVAD